MTQDFASVQEESRPFLVESRHGRLYKMIYKFKKSICRRKKSFKPSRLLAFLLNRKSKIGKSLWWSCRESNPGPNKKRGCFLHAYFAFDCRDKHGGKRPNSSLSPQISPPHRRIEAASPVFFATALPKRNQTVQSSDVSFQHLVPELR